MESDHQRKSFSPEIFGSPCIEICRSGRFAVVVDCGRSFYGRARGESDARYEIVRET